MNRHRRYTHSIPPWLLAAVLLLAGALLAVPTAPVYAQGAHDELMSLQKDDNQWAIPAKDYASTRFSKLNQINADNVKNLKADWSFSTGVLRGHEGQPLVIGETMYFITPFPHTVYALDLNGQGEIKWKFTPEANKRAVGVACCDVVNRGVSYGSGKIFFNSLDGFVFALDAETGEQVWKAKNSEVNKGETITNAPMVVKDKLIVGVSGGEFGVRGYLTAYNIETGDRMWRFHNVGPDKDVGIVRASTGSAAQEGSRGSGPAAGTIDGETSRFNPYYDWLKEVDLGTKTWPGEQWKLGGSTVWGWFSYDPDLNLVYYGTSNPGTWNPSLRRGNPDRLEDQKKYANLWSTSILARDADSGELVWAYPLTPHDEWDYDGVNENILVDMDIDGETRKTLVHFDRNGFAYVLDRTNGEVLVAEKFGPVNWADRIDKETGLPVRNQKYSTAKGKQVKNACPAAMGAKDQQPAAYSPETGLFYVPTNNLCMDYMGTEVNYVAGTPYVGAEVKMYAGPGGHRGEFIAWDAAKGEKVWGIEENFAAWSGVLATAGDVVFYGTMEGWLKAVHATSGEVLWQFKTGSGIISAPMTFMGPDGKQYLAVLSGIGGWSGLVVAGDLSLDDPTAALGAVNAFEDLPKHTRKGGSLYVFSLEE